MTNNHAKSLIDAVGHETLRDQIGLTERNLRHARSVGYFSAQWYAPIKDLAEARGVFCPLAAFKFKTPALATTQRTASGSTQDSQKLGGAA